MTFEEMEKSLAGLVAQMKHIENAQVVQGVLERRIEQHMDSLRERIDSLAAAVDATNRAVERTNRAVEKLAEVVTAHEERLVRVEDRQAEMEAAMKALLENIERLIRGLGADGHKSRERLMEVVAQTPPLGLQQEAAGGSCSADPAFGSAARDGDI